MGKFGSMSKSVGEHYETHKSTYELGNTALGGASSFASLAQDAEKLHGGSSGGGGAGGAGGAGGMTPAQMHQGLEQQEMSIEQQIGSKGQVSTGDIH